MNINEMKDRIARAEEIQQYTENRCEALEEELTEKDRQIEKMKCCANCKHYKHLVGCMIADQPNHRQCDVDNWKSWKLKE